MNMNRPNAPLPSDLPAPRTLMRSTLLAVVAAALLLVTIILPAEYGVDPTGVGGVLGLTQMGKIKLALAKEAEAHSAAEQSAREVLAAVPEEHQIGPQLALSDSAGRADVTSLTLGPNEGKEIKLVMRTGSRAVYSWTAAGGLVNFDTHAEPAQGPSGSYHSYAKGHGVDSDAGTLIAAFDGTHGWYWRNVGEAPVTVKLETRGEYEEVRVME
jgi:hypothetical protein